MIFSLQKINKGYGIAHDRGMIIRFIISLLFFVPYFLTAQSSDNGMFSLGVRTTHNSFSHDGNGIGTGGHFRIQLSERINTEWFADYISAGDELIRSNYVHIGWSVIYYPFHIIRIPKFFQRTPRALEMREAPYANLRYSKYALQPFVSAGHCFDYNKKNSCAKSQ